MNIEEFNEYRKKLNGQMADSDPFFGEFGQLDDNVYAEGAIPKNTKNFAGYPFLLLQNAMSVLCIISRNAWRQGQIKKKL